jgi:hypothetical protein
MREAATEGRCRNSTTNHNPSRKLSIHDDEHSSNRHDPRENDHLQHIRTHTQVLSYSFRTSLTKKQNHQAEQREETTRDTERAHWVFQIMVEIDILDGGTMSSERKQVFYEWFVTQLSPPSEELTCHWAKAVFDGEWVAQKITQEGTYQKQYTHCTSVNPEYWMEVDYNREWYYLLFQAPAGSPTQRAAKRARMEATAIALHSPYVMVLPSNTSSNSNSSSSLHHPAMLAQAAAAAAYSHLPRPAAAVALHHQHYHHRQPQQHQQGMMRRAVVLGNSAATAAGLLPPGSLLFKGRSTTHHGGLHPTMIGNGNEEDEEDDDKDDHDNEGEDDQEEENPEMTSPESTTPPAGPMTTTIAAATTTTTTTTTTTPKARRGGGGRKTTAASSQLITPATAATATASATSTTAATTGTTTTTTPQQHQHHHHSQHVPHPNHVILLQGGTMTEARQQVFMDWFTQIKAEPSCVDAALWAKAVFGGEWVCHMITQDVPLGQSKTFYSFCDTDYWIELGFNSEWNFLLFQVSD